MARRSPWIDERARSLTAQLAVRHGLTISDDVARDDLSDQIDLIAERMRIGRQAAKRYVTDEWIAEFADHIAALIAEHQDAVAAGSVADLDAKRAQRARGPR